MTPWGEGVSANVLFRQSIVIWITLIAAICQAQTAPGLPVGARIPNFSLADQNGRPYSFEDIRGPRGALLVFYRSADW